MGATHFPLILTYHSISEGRSPLKMPPSLFAEQMEWLRDHVKVSALSEIVAALEQRRTFPEKAVVLTFDDGFRDFYTVAAPVLRRLHLPATVFLTSGSLAVFRRKAASVAADAMLCGDDIAELAKQGFCFGAHSVSHPVLTDLPADQAKQEIAASKEQIEGLSCSRVDFFAYPYGRWNSAVRALVQEYYLGACATAAAVVQPDADLFALPRADAHYFRKPARFREMFTQRFLAYLATRRLVRRIRRKPEGFYARR